MTCTGRIACYCPFCHAPLQDSTAGWWCVPCDQVFSAAEIEATP